MTRKIVTFSEDFYRMGKDEKQNHATERPVGRADPEEFAQSLKRRGQAAKGLEKDLLTDVPLLYGSPGTVEAHGDPGIVLARLHREEMLRRNRGGVLDVSGRRSDTALPFERTVVALVILLSLFFLFGELDQRERRHQERLERASSTASLSAS